MLLSNFYAIAYLAFSYGYWNVHVYIIWLAVTISTECIARNIDSEAIISSIFFPLTTCISFEVLHQNQLFD